MRSWRDSVNDDGPAQPKIDIGSYATPVAANKDLVAVAVLYLTKDEADAIKEFARQVKAKRGVAGVQSATVAWGKRVTATNAVPEQERRTPSPTASGIDMPAGWTSFYNGPADRIEFIGPDDRRYIMGVDSTMIEVVKTCNKGHLLPPGSSWCKVCGQQDPAEAKRQLEAAKTKAEPQKPRDRFEGLEL